MHVIYCFLKMRLAKQIHNPVIDFGKGPEKPRNNNANQVDEGDEKYKKHADDADDQACAAPGMFVFENKLVKKLQILFIGFIEEIKYRSGEWNAANQRVHEHIANHFQHKLAACAMANTNHNNDERHDQGDDIAHEGEQTNKGVQAKPEAGSGNMKGGIEQLSQSPGEF